MRTDAEILEGCLAGDRRSWNEFVERFSKLVYWSIHKVISGTAFAHHPDFADEVFQDVFKRLLEKDELAKLRRAESLKKFLSVMAGRMAYDRIRAHARADKKFAELPDSEEGQIGVDEPRVLQREESAVIDAELRNLTDRERSCIEWHYLYDKTHKEIAAMLGIPQDTVSTIIRRTREKLEKGLSRKGFKDS